MKANNQDFKDRASSSAGEKRWRASTVSLPDLTARTCRHCLLQEDHPEFTPNCDEDERGRHSLAERKIWFGVVANDLYDTRSPETARRIFGEQCFDARHYLLVQQPTDAEVLALKEGRARIVLKVEATA